MRGPVFRGLILTLACSLLMSATPAAADNPQQVVKGVADEVVRILSDPALQGPANKDRRLQMIKNTIERRFDFEEMAKRSLGPSWGKLGGAQRSEFVGVFKDVLEATYADKFEKYSGEKMNFLGETRDGEYAEVRTVLVRKNDRIPMNYRLLNKSSWKVYDVEIEGVSLVGNYRSQFSQIMSQSGYGELVRRLRTRAGELRRSGGV